MRVRTVHIIAGVAKTLPRNAEVADQFELLADFLELEGSDQFRPLAYRRAGERMRGTGGGVAPVGGGGEGQEPSRVRKGIAGESVPNLENRASTAPAATGEPAPPPPALL